MGFHVGQKVECIHDNLTRLSRTLRAIFRPFAALPSKGRVYTVANFYRAADGQAMVELFELPWPESFAFLAGFNAACFRPATERSTDRGMAILRRILADHKAPIRETQP